MPPAADTVVIYDRPVARVGIGTLRLAARGDRELATRVLRRGVELGVQLIDAADWYGDGAVEELIAHCLYPYPPDLVIAVKVGLAHTSSERIEVDGRPEHLRAACEASLRRLRLDRIDLCELHGVDRRVPIEESVGALDDLRADGLVRRIGLSNVTAAELERARRTVPVAAVENRYSVLDRGGDDVVDVCERGGIAFVAWWPLGGGILTAPAASLPPMTDRQRRTRQRVHRLAEELEVASAQIAVAWLLARSSVVALIPGTTSVRHLEQLLAARALRLTPAQLALLD